MDLEPNNLSQELSHLALSDLTQYATQFGKNLIVAILVFFIGRFLVRKTTALISKILAKKGTDPSLDSFLNSLIGITLNFLLIIVIIGILGIETSSFLALFASAGVAIGMALSGTMQNFAGGVMILFFKPYKVGDYIEAQGFAGTVKEIQIFNTVLITPDNQTIIIPNGNLSTGCMRNYSTEAFRRVDLAIEVAYGTKTDLVRNTLQALIEADGRILKDAAHSYSIPMTSMGSSSIVFEMRMWVKSADFWNVKFEMTEKVYNQLNDLGIEIPFQQLDVHVRS